MFYKFPAVQFIFNREIFRLPLALRDCLWHNIIVMKRWILFIVAIMIGGIIGLIFGWVIFPVDYSNTTPEKLRIDYKSDYVLMVAEAYNAERDLAVAVQRLSLLGGKSPKDSVEEAITFADQAGYTGADLELMQTLAGDLETPKSE